MFTWDERKIRFRIDAAHKTDFHTEMSALLASEFDDPQSVSICDAGCGLGFLDLALASRFQKVTAIDVSSIALDHLRAEVKNLGIKNIEIREEDLLNDPTVIPEIYDTMVFSFFGNIREIMHIAGPRCRNKIYIIKKNDKNHRFSVSHPMRAYDSMACALKDLDELGLPFTKQDMSIEDGQPLRSLDDAEQFFRLYAQGKDKELINRDFVKAQLEETHDPVFPYYYPRKCVFSLLTVDLSGGNN